MILGINPYLIFDGNGQDAVKFYEDVLDAKILGIQTFGEMPENPAFALAEEEKNRVLHAHLKIAETDLMISDTFPGQPFQLGSNVTVSITTNDVDKTKQVFSKLEQGGHVAMPLQETFWSPAYGTVTDKFGVTWHVSTHLTDN
ncbi:VOC family protein [Anaerobacillus isosaccharinicus]|uniref:VOC family protein n=1 Tax=Anaerobacillus isosaccharinicus TaxID=1532552 RepID=A0A1S2MDN4_9BACI|nr:VOC family protein [Anaerobacillus isosaccharinicus]MBA5586428.1 VOC family protein [Anaerobacillus isosaccharinicus]QOY35329.1 VOC family protein [Anaerobacillus isosaccharinicus]